ncbi:hypothetical protein TNCT_379431 [Trichonephila clavata]|uniref:Uncharacterized protein n=1 Tax=Trichonephila clavata TaxID=2740835 RepID=A0A8X6HJ84_TRICU|nr:hypothetical protein TNCT_379431 [Trichonephila clavata]
MWDYTNEEYTDMDLTCSLMLLKNAEYAYLSLENRVRQLFAESSSTSTRSVGAELDIHHETVCKDGDDFLVPPTKIPTLCRWLLPSTDCVRTLDA